MKISLFEDEYYRDLRNCPRPVSAVHLRSGHAVQPLPRARQIRQRGLQRSGAVWRKPICSAKPAAMATSGGTFYSNLHSHNSA
jgi:hypothetical protein